MDLFINTFIPKETLDILFYKSTLGRSLKQIFLRETPLQIILEDIERYRSSYIDVLIQENLIGSRFKSDDSIMRKYKKLLEPAGDLNNALMMYLDANLGLSNIPENIRIILELLICETEKRLMMVIKLNYLFVQIKCR